jgi:hypothetical protein
MIAHTRASYKTVSSIQYCVYSKRKNQELSATPPVIVWISLFFCPYEQALVCATISSTSAQEARVLWNTGKLKRCNNDKEI